MAASLVDARTSRPGHPRRRDRRLEQFDGITRRIIDDGLLSAYADDDVVAEMHSRCAEFFDNRRQIVNFDCESIPAARLRRRSVGHWLSAAASGVRRA
jgi:hypothetical protein